MATPTRTLILNAIDTLFGTVSVANGYKTNVLTSERLLRSWAEVGSGEFPLIGWRPMVSRYERQHGSCLRVTIPIIVQGHVAGDAEATRSASINGLLDDITKAIGDNHTLSSNAVDWYITDDDTDEGHPDTIDSRGGSGTVTLRTEAVFYRLSGGS